MPRPPNEFSTSEGPIEETPTKMSQFEAVPCVVKSRDDSGKEAQRFVLLIRPSGAAGTSSAPTTTNAANVVVQGDNVLPAASSTFLPPATASNAVAARLNLTPVGSVPASALQPTPFTNGTAAIQVLQAPQKPAAPVKGSTTRLNKTKKSTNAAKTTSQKKAAQASKCVAVPPMFAANAQQVCSSTASAAAASMPAYGSYRAAADLQEDLQAIELNQLMPNTASIRTEEYLGGEAPSAAATSMRLDATAQAPVSYFDTTSTYSMPTTSQAYYTTNGDVSCSTTSQQASPSHMAVMQQMPVHHAHQAMYRNHTPYYASPEASNPVLSMPGPSHHPNQHLQHQPMSAFPVHQASTSQAYYQQWRHPVHAHGQQHGHAVTHQQHLQQAPQQHHQGQCNQLSTSPDSGIQSIDGSPPSILSFTPPLAYEPAEPTPAHQPAPLSVSSSMAPASAAAYVVDEEEDLSDMPTLQREDQQSAPSVIGDAGTDAVDSAPYLPQSANSATTSRAASTIPPRSESSSAAPPPAEGDDVFHLISSMDPSQIAEKFMNHWDQEKIQQFTSLMQAKAQPEPKQAGGESRPLSAMQDTTNAKGNPARNGGSAAKDVMDMTPSSAAAPSPVGNVDRENIENVPDASESNDYSDDDTPSYRERLRVYRLAVVRKLNERLYRMVDEVQDRFSKVKLNMKVTYRHPQPFKPIQWKRLGSSRGRNAAATQRIPRVGRKVSKRSAVDELPVRKPRRSAAESSATQGRKARRKESTPAERETSPPEEKKIKPRKTRKRKREPEEPSEFRERSMSSSKLPSTRNSLDVSDGAAIQKRRRSRNTKDEYVKIRTNVLLEAPLRLPSPEACECRADEACLTRNCPHRAANVECTQSTCRIHAECRNRRMLNNEAVHQLQIFETNDDRGRGIRTTVKLHAGQFICEFVGEVLKLGNYQTRHLMRSVEQPRFGIQLTPGYVVDATFKGNIARFLNHSCQPNCELQRWQVGPQYRLGVFAKRPIEEGEELTFSYESFARMEPEQECRCGAAECAGVLPSQTPPRPVANEPETLSAAQLALVRDEHVFLPRNLRRFGRKPNLTVSIGADNGELSRYLLTLYNDVLAHAQNKEKIPRRRLTQLAARMRHAMHDKHDEVDIITSFDSTVKSWINSLQPHHDRRQAEALRSHYSHLKKTRDVQKHLTEPRTETSSELAKAFTEEKKKPNAVAPGTSKKGDTRVLSADADLSYMKDGPMVGSYDPDVEAARRMRDFFDKEGADGETEEDRDCVRCLCGITEDDGAMVECDKCKYWLHADCVGYTSNDGDEFECKFCTDSLEVCPPIDILLQPQPDYHLEGCKYYRALVNKYNIQVRINESVYVKKGVSEDHKVSLKQLNDADRSGEKRQREGKKSRQKRNRRAEAALKQSEAVVKPVFNRSDLRCFRIERLFSGPGGERFVFGCYYARPHETFCDSTRMFHRKELFWTPFFNTLPLDAVVGRCLVLEPQTYCEGRPKAPYYHEEDVYFCDFQIDKNQRTFTRTSNHYMVNKAPYAFDKFSEPAKMKRDFTPFVIMNGEKKADRNEFRERCNSNAKQLSISHLKKVWERLKGTRRERRPHRQAR